MKTIFQNDVFKISYVIGNVDSIGPSDGSENDIKESRRIARSASIFA